MIYIRDIIVFLLTSCWCAIGAALAHDLATASMLAGAVFWPVSICLGAIAVLSLGCTLWTILAAFRGRSE